MADPKQQLEAAHKLIMAAAEGPSIALLRRSVSRSEIKRSIDLLGQAQGKLKDLINA